MREKEQEKDNPLGMKLLSPYGGYALPSLYGSQRRIEFFQRETTYLASAYLWPSMPTRGKRHSKPSLPRKRISPMRLPFGFPG